MKDKIREMLAFEDLTQEEKEKRGILGRLYGPCASISVPTRNGRGYNESLWENVFEHNDIVNEMFANGGIPMELDHPVDREETDSNKIAAMMPEKPKKDKDGKLVTYCDIIDTPAGRVAYALAKYGFKLGISSRGSGDIIQDEDGNDIVDPDTYDFTTFDLVLLPAVKDARLTMVEGLEKDKNVKQSIHEELEHCKKLDGTEYTKAEKEMMLETLDKLNLEPSTEEDSTTSDSVDIEADKEETKEAINDGTESIIKSLQESLKSNAELEAKIMSLQNELAVRDAKVSKLEEELSRDKSTIVRLTGLAKDSREKTEKISNLENQLSESKKTIESLNEKLTSEKEKIRTTALKPLRESVSKKNDEIKSLNEQLETLKKDSTKEITSLKESLRIEKESHVKEVNSLKESLSLAEKRASDAEKLNDKIALRYIKSKAKVLGVEPEQILNRLSESYTLNEVDAVCEKLKSIKINMSKLPIALDSNSVVELKEAKHVNVSVATNDDDYVDASTYDMAGISKKKR